MGMGDLESRDPPSYNSTSVTPPDFRDENPGLRIDGSVLVRLPTMFIVPLPENFFTHIY